MCVNSRIVRIGYFAIDVFTNKDVFYELIVRLCLQTDDKLLYTIDFMNYEAYTFKGFAVSG